MTAVLPACLVLLLVPDLSVSYDGKLQHRLINSSNMYSKAEALSAQHRPHHQPVQHALSQEL